MSKQQQHHSTDTSYQRQQKYINSSSTSAAVQSPDVLGSTSSTSTATQVKNATQISGIAIITTNNNKENKNFIQTTMKPNHSDMDLDSLFDGTYGGASDDLSLNYNLLINNLEPIELTDEQITATTKLNGQRYSNHQHLNNNNHHHNHQKMINNNEHLSHNNDYNNNTDPNDTNNNTKINSHHYRSGKHRSYNKRPSAASTAPTTTNKRFKTTPKTAMDVSTTTTTPLNQKFNHKATNHDPATAMRYNIEEKLRELFIELIADRATCSYLKEFNLKRTSFLLDKLVLRDKLNTLIITLYPGNKGYSLAFRKNNLHDHHYGGTMPATNATAIGRKPLLNDCTNSPSIEILHETMVWPYEDADLLDCLDNEEIPQALMDFLHAKCLHLFYSGCVVAEIRDYRQSFPVVDICDNYHVLLRPSYQNILAAVHQHSDGTWSPKDKLTLESQLVLATAEPMCLDPDPRVGIDSINEQSRRIVFNGTAIKRQMAKYSQCAMNRKRKVDSKTQNYGLELPDFLLRAKKVQALKRSAVAALRPPEVQGKPEMGQRPSSEVNALKHGRRYPRLSDNYNDGDKKNEKYRKIDDWAPQLIEEFTLETERDNGIYHVKVSLFQRASNSEYSGELYVDRHYKPNEVNGKTCRFVLGSQAHANRYIQEFKEIFTEEGRKSVKITHEIPGQKPIITCTGTLLHQQIQARHAAQVAAAAAATAAAQAKRQVTLIPVTPPALPRTLIASPVALQNGNPESPKTVVLNTLPAVSPVRDTFVVPPAVTPVRDNFVVPPATTPVRDNFVVPPPVTPVRDNFVVQTVLPEFTIKATAPAPAAPPPPADNKPPTETKLLLMQPTQLGDPVARANLHQQLQQRQQRQFQQIQPQLSPQLQQQLQTNSNENNSTIRQILRQPPAPMNQSTYHQPTTMYVNNATEPMTLYTFTDLQQNVQLLAGNALVSTSPLVLSSNNQLDFTATAASGALTVDASQHQQQLPGNRHRQV